MYDFASPLTAALQSFPDRRAITCDGATVTFAEHVDRIRRLAAAIVAKTEPEERVAIWALNSQHFLELYMAIPLAGRVVVPLNTRWSEPELVDALEDADAVMLFTDRDPGAMADVVREVVSIPDGHEELIASVPEGEGFALSDSPGEDALAGLFYTGGTTGRSKGVMLTHRNIVSNALNTQTMITMADTDTYLVVAPLFHAAGSVSVLQCYFLGIEQVILPTFTPGGALDLIQEHSITGTLAVPTMIAAMNEEHRATPRDTSTVRFVAHGASPIAQEVLKRALETFPNAEFLHVYGATETAPLLTGLRHEELLVGDPKGKSVGRAIMGIDLRILDSDGQELPRGEIGEVVVRGPNVTKGYWKRPEETRKAIQDGWYWTGDVGRLDDEGNLHLHDRSKDMIISGGENVYCTEVEDAIYSHPKVLEATVFGIPSDEWGETVHAVVVKRDESLTAEELVAHVRESIAGYKVPRSIEFRDEPLPVSGPGKVLKRELRKKYWEGQERSVS